MGKINRDNIEAWLLDLAEGSINEADEKEVLAFLEQNPEYKELLALYDKDFVLQQEESIIFEDKESLKHKAVFPLWRKIVYVSLSAAAVILLLMLLKPTKESITDTAEHSSPVARQEKNVAEPDKETPLVKENVFTPEKKGETTGLKRASLVYEEEKTVVAPKDEEHCSDMVAKQEPTEENIAKNTNLIAQNTTASNKTVNDTVYIVYIGDRKQTYAERFSYFVEKYTDINLAPAISFIRQAKGKVKETKNKYLKI